MLRARSASSHTAIFARVRFSTAPGSGTGGSRPVFGGASGRFGSGGGGGGANSRAIAREFPTVGPGGFPVRGGGTFRSPDVASKRMGDASGSSSDSKSGSSLYGMTRHGGASESEATALRALSGGHTPLVDSMPTSEAGPPKPSIFGFRRREKNEKPLSNTFRRTTLQGQGRTPRTLEALNNAYLSEHFQVSSVDTVLTYNEKRLMAEKEFAGKLFGEEQLAEEEASAAAAEAEEAKAAEGKEEVEVEDYTSGTMWKTQEDGTRVIDLRLGHKLLYQTLYNVQNPTTEQLASFDEKMLERELLYLLPDRDRAEPDPRSLRTEIADVHKENLNERPELPGFFTQNPQFWKTVRMLEDVRKKMAALCQESVAVEKVKEAMAGEDDAAVRLVLEGIKQNGGGELDRKTVSQTLLDVFLEQGKTRVVSGMWGAKEALTHRNPDQSIVLVPLAESTIERLRVIFSEYQPHLMVRTFDWPSDGLKIESREGKALMRMSQADLDSLPVRWLGLYEMERVIGEKLGVTEYSTIISNLFALRVDPRFSAVSPLVSDFIRKLPSEPQKSSMEQDNMGILSARAARKTARGQVWMKKGTGKCLINDVPLPLYFRSPRWCMEVARPLNVTYQCANWDIYCYVKGGGHMGQAEAIRYAISRCLSSVNPDFYHLLFAEHLTERDIRKKERKKSGQEGARRKFQWVKR